MKKLAKYMVAFSLCVMVFLSGRVEAYGASASLSGPSGVRAGDTITLTLSVSDKEKYGLEGSFSYDSSQVSLSSVSCNISGWKVETSGKSFIVYDDALSNPLNGNRSVLTVRFKVKDGVDEGTRIQISANGLVATDGSEESSIGSASYSTTIRPPLSSNADLSSLSVSEGSLSPSFDADTTTYTLSEVEFDVTRLTISYETDDDKASAAIRANALDVGDNTVSVVVTAEDGTSKTYRIQVVRKQDPNYKESSNAKLASVTTSSGSVSPHFASDVTDYIVYLPYEEVGEKFTVSGKAAHDKAKKVKKGTIEALVEGENSTVVTCVAEDGTEKQYKFTVVVMPQYTGVVPELGENDAEIEDVENTEGYFEDNKNTNTGAIDTSTEEEEGPGAAIAVVIIVILVGILVYVLFFLNRRNRHM